MKNSYEKFIVKRLETTPSGNYAIHERGGFEVYTGNYGYKPNDEVEIWIGHYDGYGDTPYAPDLIKVNGNEIWGKKDRDYFLKNRERIFSDYITSNLQKKDIHHPKYNPKYQK